MSAQVPSFGHTPGPIGILTDPAGGPVLTRLGAFARQPAVRRTLPLFGGLAALGAVALTWMILAPAPQRVLYSELGDAEKARVVGALDKAAIAYRLDDASGALTVDSDELYRARMLVASDGALATPDSGTDMLDKLPLGASRAVEGDRLRSAREHELILSLMEIDGVEAARVHLAEPQRSVFVRDEVPPTASVMLRLARGRQLADGQVTAVINLVAGSVPGLSVDAVRVLDQHGRLLSAPKSADGDRLQLQARMEEKLRGQLDQLLLPMLGEGNFSSEIQVELDMDDVTRARESYEKQGVVRSETQSQSQSQGGGQAIGVPGVLSNTPPPTATASAGPPLGTPAATGPAANNGESSTARTYELGREVSVANSGPGKIKRISVAVALSQAALKKGKAADVEQIKQLVSAAVGIDAQRGDQVAVVARAFQPPADDALPFYEAGWFGPLVRGVIALIGVLLVLLFAVRPLLRLLRREPGDAANERPLALEARAAPGTPIDGTVIGRQIELAQRMVEEKPEQAVVALRRMLAQQGAAS